MPAFSITSRSELVRRVFKNFVSGKKKCYAFLFQMEKDIRLGLFSNGIIRISSVIRICGTSCRNNLTVSVTRTIGCDSFKNIWTYIFTHCFLVIWLKAKVLLRFVLEKNDQKKLPRLYINNSIGLLYCVSALLEWTFS
jgi:hypothetical protein